MNKTKLTSSHDLDSKEKEREQVLIALDLISFDEEVFLLHPKKVPKATDESYLKWRKALLMDKANKRKLISEVWSAY